MIRKALLVLLFGASLAGCSGEPFDKLAYRSAVKPLVSSAEVGNQYRASLIEVDKGDVVVQIDFYQSPGSLLVARRAGLGYCERLVSSIHEKLDPKFPDLNFASCRIGRDRGSMRDVYGAVRYGKGVGFKVRDQ